MSLKVIGAGWGRTGTESLKKALEILDFGKCYHAFELMKHPQDIVYWEKLHHGEKPDYEKLFDGYQSSVDFPACIFYKQFLEKYPDAKVILSVRDKDKWYESASKTIFKFRKMPTGMLIAMRLGGIFSSTLRIMPRAFRSGLSIIHFGFLEGRMDDEVWMKEKFTRWNEEVKRHVPAEKLLVYEVKDGWEPLCKFLNVPVPNVPFPKSNDSDSFQKRLKTKNFIKEIEQK
ncbi:MAG TPA: sulfotransferase [Chitinophagales bacterium]|nr:sulfotransferase [Chitinophagales bacterium]